jgi:hypothetical protein
VEATTATTYRLAVTRRCLDEDLGIVGVDDWRRHLDDRTILRAFQERRSQRPIGQERLLDLIGVIQAPVFTLHAEQARGGTWYDEEEEIVWLVGVGQAHDYDHLVNLGQRGRLLPTVDDYEQFEIGTAASFADTLVAEARALVRLAADRKDEPVEQLLAGRIPVRVCWETADPDFLVVAISERIRPGDATLGKEWQLTVAAAFFPGVPFDEFPPFPFDFDNTEVRSDELAIRHFAPHVM